MGRKAGTQAPFISISLPQGSGASQEAAHQQEGLQQDCPQKGGGREHSSWGGTGGEGQSPG